MKYNELQSRSPARPANGLVVVSPQARVKPLVVAQSARCRTGKKHAHGFIGGQGVLMQRIPKARGFSEQIRVKAQAVYLINSTILRPPP